MYAELYTPSYLYCMLVWMYDITIVLSLQMNWKMRSNYSCEHLQLPLFAVYDVLVKQMASDFNTQCLHYQNSVCACIIVHMQPFMNHIITLFTCKGAVHMCMCCCCLQMFILIGGLIVLHYSLQGKLNTTNHQLQMQIQ